jgi:hypothetical protein
VPFCFRCLRGEVHIHCTGVRTHLVFAAPVGRLHGRHHVTAAASMLLLPLLAHVRTGAATVNARGVHTSPAVSLAGVETSCCCDSQAHNNVSLTTATVLAARLAKRT